MAMNWGADNPLWAMLAGGGAGALSAGPGQSQFGTGLQGMLGGAQMAQQMQQARQIQAMREFQMADARRKQDEAAARQAAIARMFERPPAQYAMAGGARPGPTPQAAQAMQPPVAQMFPGADVDALQGYATAFPDQFAQVMGQRLLPKEPKAPAVQEFFDEQGRPYKAQFTGKSWERVGGAKTPDWQNSAYQDFALKRAAAGKSDVSVKVDQKTGESLAKPIGEIVQGTQAGALGAIDTLDTVNRIRSAMTSANLGPTATLRQGIDRIASTLGIGGATTDERLANTQSVVKGLAELTLSGRKALKGQGQVSDYEGKLLERAVSGDIELTAPEISTILDVADRVARKQYGLHEANIKRLRDNPGYSDLAPFYEVPPLPQAAQPKATGGQRIRFDAQGNIIQ
jgi:hypothetical protein